MRSNIFVQRAPKENHQPHGSKPSSFFTVAWIKDSSSRKCAVDFPSLKRRGSKGGDIKMYANGRRICLEASHWLSKSLTRNQSSGASSCREMVGGWEDHYLGFRESSFVWHLPLKVPGSKKTAANSNKLTEKEAPWLPTQCQLMSISLCLSAGGWRSIEWEGSWCPFTQRGQVGRASVTQPPTTSSNAYTASRASQDINKHAAVREDIRIFYIPDLYHWWSFCWRVNVVYVPVVEKMSCFFSCPC